jgi:HTH-type transcriptional regulator/antitoxin MqsA
MKVSDRALNRLKAQVEGLLDPEAVRRIRKRLHLTQKDAGRLIGGGPNAFQKYESGDVVVSHAVMSALLLLDRDPSGLSVLKQRVHRKEEFRVWGV